MIACRCSKSSKSSGRKAVESRSEKPLVVGVGGNPIGIDIAVVMFRFCVAVGRELSFRTIGAGGCLDVNSSFSAAAVDGTLSSPLLVAVVMLVVVVPVTLLSPEDEGKTVDNPELEAERVRLRLSAPELEFRYPVVVGVALRRESIVIDIAEPGRGLGLGLTGISLSESVVSLDEYPLSSAHVLRILVEFSYMFELLDC